MYWYAPPELAGVPDAVEVLARVAVDPAPVPVLGAVDAVAARVAAAVGAEEAAVLGAEEAAVLGAEEAAVLGAEEAAVLGAVEAPVLGAVEGAVDAPEPVPVVAVPPPQAARNAPIADADKPSAAARIMKSRRERRPLARSPINCRRVVFVVGRCSSDTRASFNYPLIRRYAIPPVAAKNTSPHHPCIAAPTDNTALPPP